MNSRTKTKSLLLLSSILTSGLTMPVFAAQSETMGTLEEIMVTAQKRSESLQAVSLSLTAFSGDFLEKSRIENFTDLETRVPGLVYEDFSPGQPRYFIRGIGNISKSAAMDGAVGIFVDEVYLGRPEMLNNNFFDLARLEVLRGPQGTLFGRNVVGGAISFFTRVPDEELRMKASVTYGNYGLVEGQYAISGPISDKLFAGVSVAGRLHDGYAFNETTGNDVGDEQFVSGRATFRYLPNDDLEVTLRADASRRRGTGTWWDLYSEGSFSQGNSNADPRRGAMATEDGFGDVDNEGVSLTVDWQTNIGTFRSISAYRHSILRSRANTTGLYVAELDDPERFNYHHTLFIQEDDQWTDQYTQEFRLTSDGEGPLNWVTGLFYLHDDVERLNITDYRFVFYGTEGVSQNIQNNQTDSYAAYANVSYDITQDLKLQGGLRWSHDKKHFSTVASGDPFTPYTSGGVPVSGFSAEAKNSWSAWTPAISLNYNLARDKFVYASVSRGFKSGGFGGQTDQVAAESSFAPEYAWNYELGAKTEWLDRRLRLNVTAFYLDYTDLQVGIITQPDPDLPPIGVAGNAGKARVKGVELEWNVVPIEGLNIYGNYAYTKSDIKDLVVGGTDLTGNRLARAPKHKFFAGTSYTVPLAGGSSLTGRVDFTYSSRFFNTINNSPVAVVPGQHTLDGSLRYDMADGRWALEVWGKNLTDELNINSIADVIGDGYASYTEPRTYGITAHFKY